MSAPSQPSPEALVVLVDSRGEPTGTCKKSDAHRGEGLMHLAFTAVLLDPRGRVILSQRAATKPLWPKAFDATVASHPLPSETPLAAALRRVEEELGAPAKLAAHGVFRYHARYKQAGGFGGGSEREHCHVLLGTLERAPRPDPAEVAELKVGAANSVAGAWARDPKGVCPWAPLALLSVWDHLPGADPATRALLERAVAVWPDLERL